MGIEVSPLTAAMRFALQPQQQQLDFAHDPVANVVAGVLQQNGRDMRDAASRLDDDIGSMKGRRNASVEITLARLSTPEN
jgi:hypothetical protein